MQGDTDDVISGFTGRCFYKASISNLDFVRSLPQISCDGFYRRPEIHLTLLMKVGPITYASGGGHKFVGVLGR